MEASSKIKRFMEPSSVALIGVPRRAGRASFNILETLLQIGFEGKVYPVNPSADSILGVKAYPEVKALPPGIELAVIMLSREAVPGIVRECVEKDIKAIAVVSEGFAEADERGKTLQDEIVRIATSHGVRILGPNSLGVVNNFHRFTTTFLPFPRKQIEVAFITQSGGLFEGFADFTAGKAIDLGNMSDVEFADALEYFEDDLDTKVIALHIEGIRNGRKFMKTARRVNEKKPILALKTGRSELGARATFSHTGSLTGSDAVYDAVFKQLGIIRVENVDELGDITKALLHLPPLRGNKIGIITPTGAGAAMVLDAMTKHGFELAKLRNDTIEAIREYFPPWAPPHNPIDMMAAAIAHEYKAVYQASLEALLKDPGIDAILCIAGFPTLKTIKNTVGAETKPVITWVLGNWGHDLLSRIEETRYRAVYPTPERAVRALAALRERSARQSNQN